MGGEGGREGRRGGWREGCKRRREERRGGGRGVTRLEDQEGLYCTILTCKTPVVLSNQGFDVCCPYYLRY